RAGDNARKPYKMGISSVFPKKQRAPARAAQPQTSPGPAIERAGLIWADLTEFGQPWAGRLSLAKLPSTPLWADRRALARSSDDGTETAADHCRGRSLAARRRKDRRRQPLVRSRHRAAAK